MEIFIAGGIEWWIYVHNKVDTSQLIDASINSRLQALNAPDVYRSDSQHLGSFPGCSDVLSHVLGLFDVAAHDAGVCAEVDQCPDLGAAYCARTTGTEDDFAICSAELA